MANFSMSPVYLRDQIQDGSILAIGELVKRSNAWGRTRSTAWVVDGIVTSIYTNATKIEVCTGWLAQNPNGAIFLPWVDGDTLYQNTSNPHLIATTGNVSVGKKYAGVMGAWYADGLLFEVNIINPIFYFRSWFLSTPTNWAATFFLDNHNNWVHTNVLWNFTVTNPAPAGKSIYARVITRATVANQTSYNQATYIQSYSKIDWAWGIDWWVGDGLHTIAANDRAVYDWKTWIYDYQIWVWVHSLSVESRLHRLSSSVATNLYWIWEFGIDYNVIVQIYYA